MRLSKNLRRCFKALIFLMLFVVLTLILDAAFELDETVTEKMLTAYSKTPEIDTIFVGNSVGEMMDADLYSALSGTHSFNMCTPSQSIELSLKNIKLAASHHEIKNATLLMSIDMVDDEDYSRLDQLYYRVVDSSTPWNKRIIVSIKRRIQKSLSPELYNTEKSINVFIPWENETAHGLDKVKENLERRFKRLINNDPVGKNIAFDLNTIRYNRLPDDLSEEEIKMLNEDLDTASELSLPEGMISSGNLTRIAKICKFCKENRINLRIVVTPHTTEYFDRYESFREYNKIADEYLEGFISKRGGEYYDTEDDPEVHEILPDKYFSDQEHMSDKYYGKSTEYLYRVLCNMGDI